MTIDPRSVDHLFVVFSDEARVIETEINEKSQQMKARNGRRGCYIRQGDLSDTVNSSCKRG